MEQEAIYVGVDVSKAQLDVAVRPTGDSWEVSRDEAGVRQLVSRLKALEPAWCCWRLRVAWNCLWWLRWQPKLYQWSSSTLDR